MRFWQTGFLALLFCGGVGSSLGEELTGAIYDVLLEADADPSGIESHLGEVVFDGLSDPVPYDAGSDPPPLAGNDLVATESAQDLGGGLEAVDIVIEAAAPGGSLFVNSLDSDGVVVFDVTGLTTASDVPYEVDPAEIEVSVSFSGGEVEPTEPLFVDVAGDGTSADPLFILLELDPADFDLHGPATDLHLGFTGQVVPEPSTLILCCLALASGVACRCRPRRRR